MTDPPRHPSNIFNHEGFSPFPSSPTPITFYGIYVFYSITSLGETHFGKHKKYGIRYTQLFAAAKVSDFLLPLKPPL